MECRCRSRLLVKRASVSINYISWIGNCVEIDYVRLFGHADSLLLLFFFMFESIIFLFVGLRV